MIILVDFDRTLYDTDRMISERDEIYRINRIDPELCRQVYDETKRDKGYFDPTCFYRRLNERQQGLGDRVEQIDKDFDYSKYLFPFALQALKILEQLGKVVIFSNGDPYFQRRKIESCISGLEIAVYKDKVSNIGDFLKEDEKIVVIDDNESVLKSLPPNIIKIRISDFSEYQHFSNILEAANYLKNEPEGI